MKRHTFALLGLVLIFAIPNFTSGQYARVYGGGQNERAYALSEGVIPGTNIREYVLGGWTESYNPRRNPLLIGVNQGNGNFIWGLIARDTGEIRSIVKTYDGFVFTGYLSLLGSSSRQDIMVGKVSASGQFQWGRIYRALMDDVANSIIGTQDGGYAVCGWTYSFGPDPKPNIIILKLDSQGNLRWSRVYWFSPHLGTDQALSITELPFYHNYPSMRYAIVGRTQMLDTLHYDAFVMALDSLGNPFWARVIPGIRDDEAHSVVVSRDTITVAGWTNSFSETFDADIFLWNMWAYHGSPIWRNTYGIAHFDEKVGDDRCLTLNTPIGTTYPYRFLVSGWTKHTPATGGTDFQYLTVRSNGALEWARRHPSFANGSPHLEEAYPCLISGGRIAIAGWSNNNLFSLGEDMHLLRTPLNGLNRVCTARDTLRRYSFIDTIGRCFTDSAGLYLSNFRMDTLWVPMRQLCTTRLTPIFESVPSPTISVKPIKSGGGMVALGGGNSLYLLVGNNTREFLKYSLEEESWSRCESVPLGPNNKKVKKGACMVAVPPRDGKGVEGEIYLLKGGGTNEFYCYDPTTNSWSALPEPNFTKGVKGGFMAPMVVNDCTYIYAGSGYKNEWKRFNLQSGQWQPCIPETLPGGKWKIGSSMDWFFAGEKNEHLPNHIIMMRAGGRTNEIYELSPQPDPPGFSFKRLANLPLQGRSARKKKVGEGGSIKAFNPEPSNKGTEAILFFAVKGKNTKEFWQFEYNPQEKDTGRWTQLEDIPSTKGIKGGGCLVYSPWDLGVYFLIGNNTREIFVYYPPLEEPTSFSFQREPSAMGRIKDKTSPLLNISNPIKGMTTVYYNLPTKEMATLKI